MKFYLLPEHAVVPDDDLSQHVALILFEPIECRDKANE